MNEIKSRVVDERTTDVPSYNIFSHVNSKLGRLHTKAPLTLSIYELTVPTQPIFDVPKEPDKCKCCETGPTVFRPYPRRLASVTVCRCHYKGSTFFSVI